MAMSRRYNHTMSPSFAPLKLLLMMFVGWVNRHQLDVIEYRQPRREDCRYYSPSRQPMDDADRAKSHRPERRLPSRQALFDSRSRYQILGRIPQRSRVRRHSRHSTAATIAQFERFRGTVRAFN